MLVGLKQQLASDFATEKGFDVQVEHGASNDVPSGFVYLQSAREGSMLADGATLTIWVSSG